MVQLSWLLVCTAERLTSIPTTDNLYVCCQMVSASGASTRSFTAIELEETVSIGYGEEQQDCKEYELRSITFYVGSSSTNGHYTCAERTQTLSGYKWRYLDSDETPVDKSLAELYKEQRQGRSRAAVGGQDSARGRQGSCPGKRATQVGIFMCCLLGALASLACCCCRLSAAWEVGLVMPML